MILKGLAFLLLACLSLFTAIGQKKIPLRPNLNQGAGVLESGHPWQVGGTFAGGFAPGYAIPKPSGLPLDFRFYSGGVQLGRVLVRAGAARRLGGNGEAVVEVLPFWDAVIPRQTIVIHTGPLVDILHVYAISRHGATVTPLLLRWNFTHLVSGARVVPYAQLGGGLLWTARKFPDVTAGPNKTTSRINFTPQGALGAHVFVRDRQSVDWRVEAIHYSSAGLGDYNPGVGVTVQFGVGYSWWKR